MSQKIAPGKWDPLLRMAAKQWTRVVGVVLIAVGVGIGLSLTESVLLDSDRAPSLWLVVFVAVPSIVPLVVGSVMALPDVFTPLVYRLLDEIDGRRQGGDS